MAQYDFQRTPDAAPGDLTGGTYNIPWSADPNRRHAMPLGGGSQRPNPKSQSTGLAAMNEGLGLASEYRPSGYIYNRNAGYVGGSYDDSQASLNQYSGLAGFHRAGAEAAVQDYKAGMGNAAGDRMRQAEAQDMYMALARGQGPSLAALQLQQGLRQSQAQQASIAAGARGGGANLAAAQLAGATMAGQLAAQTNEQAAMVRAQEQLGALQGAGQMASSMRGMDYQQAGLGLQSQDMQLTNARAYEEMRQRQQLAELEQQAAIEKAQGEAELEQQRGFAKAEQESASTGIPILGSFFKALSDERTKTDKRDAGADIDARLDRLRAMSYRYKDEPRGTKRIGPMAQDMPAETVEELPNGVKVVRMPEAIGFGLAGMARLNERIRKLERAK